MSGAPFFRSPSDLNSSSNMSFTVSNAVDDTTNKLSELKVVIDEAQPIRPEPYPKAPLTFLIAKLSYSACDGMADFQAFEYNLPSLAGSIKHVASMAYIGDRELRTRFPEYYFFVGGKWRDGKWEYIREDEEVKENTQYVVIMTNEERKIWRINGATYALSTDYNRVNWSLSLLATSVFAKQLIFDSQWKRIPNQKEYGCKIQRRGLSKIIDRGDVHYTTYLEMIFKSISDYSNLGQFVATMAIKGGVTCRLDDICAAGGVVVYDEAEIKDAKMSSKTVRVSIPGNFADLWVRTRPIFAIDGSFHSGTSILQIMSGYRYFFSHIYKVENSYEVLLKKPQEELDKQQGKIICHFIYGTRTDPKVATEFVPIGSSLFSVLPTLSALFDVPITILGCRLVHLVEDGMIVTKYGADNDELKEFAAYLFEEEKF